MENYLTYFELMNLIQVNRESVDRYIQAERLPKPIMSDGEYLFNKKEVIEKIGVKDLNEPFISTRDGAKILGISEAQIRSFCTVKKWNLPHYKINPNRGAALLFRESELKEYKRVFIEKHGSFYSFQVGYEKIIDMFKIILDIADIPSKKKLILKKLLIQGKSKNEVAKSMGLTIERIRQIYIEGIEEFPESFRNLRKENADLKEIIRNKDKEIKYLTKKIAGILKNSTYFGKVKTVEELIVGIPDIQIKQLRLSQRALNCLISNQITTLAALSSKTKKEIYQIKGIGIKVIKELEIVLEDYGLKFMYEI